MASIVEWKTILLPGDVVVLKGSDYSQHMTVEFVTTDPDKVNVVWFDTNNKLHRDDFKSEWLGKVIA